MSQALVGNGRLGGNERTSAFQIQFERPPNRMKSPIVRITIVSTGPPSTGLMTIRSSATPPTKAITSVSANATQYPSPWSISVQAMKVVNVAISPCAKFTTPVER